MLGKAAVDLLLDFMGGLFQKRLDLPALFRGKQELAPVIPGAALHTDVAFFPQALDHAGQRSHGTAEVPVDLRQGCALFTMAVYILQNMSLYRCKLRLCHQAVCQQLHLDADLPVGPDHPPPVDLCHGFASFRLLRGKIFRPYVFIAQSPLRVKFKYAIFYK